MMPEAQDVIGTSLGSRKITVDEAYAYMDAVDAASDRVITGTYATSSGAVRSGTRWSAGRRT